MSSPLSVAPLRRIVNVRAVIQVEILTVALITVEAGIAIGAGRWPERKGWFRMRRGSMWHIGQVSVREFEKCACTPGYNRTSDPLATLVAVQKAPKTRLGAILI
jgi:hypothetical protein